jgi:hypothetical protein
MVTMCKLRLCCLSLLVLLLAGCGLASPPEEEFNPSVPNSTLAPHSIGTTFYIRPDGGTLEQCTGLVDAPYPGSGTGQPCAWDHPFRVFVPPHAATLLQGGDTLIIATGSYEMGYGAPGSENCGEEDSYECQMAPVPSGPDPEHPTRILGQGWDMGCADPPELWGSGRPWSVFNMTDASNVEVGCLEITDHSSCIEDHVFVSGGSPLTCERDTPPYGDWAAAGLYAEDAANVYLHDLYIHGLANTGVLAGRLTDWTVENVRISGNGLAGWNGDLVGDGSESEYRGTLTFRHLTIEWNGCGETWPDGQHTACWGQEAGGYGDGFGAPTSAGHWIFEDSAFLNNTSDGLDMLYIRLPGSAIEIRRTVAAGNDGNQIKVSGNSIIIENSLIVSNCGAFHDMPYWNPDDDCRAGGDALALFVNPGGQAIVVNSTISGEGNCLMVAGCALDKTCDGSETIQVRNTILLGQPVFFSPGDDTCFAWYDDESTPPMPRNPFIVEYSLISGVRFGNVEPCPGGNNLCGVGPILASSAIDSFDGHLGSGSPAVNAGNPAWAPPDDLEGRLRDARPDIGVYEQ